jgi:hypothetical protein
MDRDCAVCRQVIDEDALVFLTLRSARMEREGESQTVFMHKTCLVERMDPVVPLHPDFTGQAHN